MAKAKQVAKGPTQTALITAPTANEAAYAELVSAFQSQAGLTSQAKDLSEKRRGNYSSIVHAAALCANRLEWDATEALLRFNITHNIDHLAEHLGAKPRKETTADGAAFTMPLSVTNALSVVGFAWGQGMAFTMKDKKTGKETPVPFSSLRDARQLHKQKEDEKVAKSFTGDQKTRYEIGLMQGQITKLVGTDIPSATLAKIHASLRAAVTAAAGGQKTHAKAGSKPADDVAEDLSQAA